MLIAPPRHAGWSTVSDLLWVVGIGLAAVADVAQVLADLAATGAARAHFRSLPEPSVPCRRLMIERR